MAKEKRLIFAELKSSKGKLTPTQEQWLEALKETGVEAYVWRPADYDEAVTILARGMR